MGRRVKKTKSNNSGADQIPEDLVMEIVGRLPVKTVARFLLVSKSWARIIRSREFIVSFPLGSCSSQPRLLVAYVDITLGMQSQDWECRFFSSSYSSSTSLLSRVAHSFPIDLSTQKYHCGFAQVNRRTGTYVSGNYRRHELEYYYSHYVNGLISLGYGQEQIICNPSTGHFTILPKVVEATGLLAKSSFFGYEPVNGEYKVLCMTKKRGDGPYQKYQVFTLGAEPKSWRMIDSSIPHSPLSNGLCLDGAVYYIASTPLGQTSLMRFDLRSEELDRFTSLPSDLQAADTLINYEGKIAIPLRSRIDM
ncbi:unnamed protein product [Thlaspi arvense]|uniref:F-box domain-containing protein n=1 Tax=Thlaspi arvense TaxID=13288 RepID=A0AAU9STP8_THLAR|nr:unnamed protein product [Thlaspi arvense]